VNHLMVNLFKGYESMSDKEFVAYICLKKYEYNEGGSIFGTFLDDEFLPDCGEIKLQAGLFSFFINFTSEQGLVFNLTVIILVRIL